MNLGIIGAGVMGKHHARIYDEIASTNPDVHLTGIADIDPRVEIIAKKYGVKAYTDYHELLKSGLDAVSICVPTSMHKDVAIAAINSGVRGILVEKPISDNVMDAHEIIAVARNKGVYLLVGHVERFNPVVMLMQNIINSGRLGNVVSISAKRVGPSPPRITDTGVIIDVAVHDLEIICHLFGIYPTDVYAFAGQSERGREDRASIMLKFSGQRSGMLETNWLSAGKIRTLDIVGLKAVAHVDYLNQTISINDTEKDEDTKFHKQEPLMKELLHFINVIRGVEIPMVTGEGGLMALKLALAAVQSYKTGQVQRL